MRNPFSMHMLGTLPPGPENELKSQIAQIEALQQQVVGDVILTGRQGADITSHQLQVNAATDQITAMRAEIETLEPADVSDWQARAELIKKALLQQLKDLANLREGSFNMQGISGLLWGFGIATAVAGAGYYVWRHKRR